MRKGSKTDKGKSRRISKRPKRHEENKGRIEIFPTTFNTFQSTTHLPFSSTWILKSLAAKPDLEKGLLHFWKGHFQA